MASATENPSGAGTSVEVKLAHRSVKEYLVSKMILDGPAKAYGIQAGKANARIAETCLAYLLQFDKFDSLTSRSVEDFPLALYAAEYWIHHAWLAPSEISMYSLLSVEFFGRQKEAFLNWVRLCDIDRSQNSDLIKNLDKTCPPFCYASVVGLFKPMKLLLQRGADFYAQGGRYKSAADVASRLDYETVVRVLRDQGPDINTQENHALILSVMGYAFDDVMRSLFDNAHVQNTIWRNPLDSACFMKNKKAVRLLLGKRVEFNIQDKDLSSALAAASCGGASELIPLLLENGADINTGFRLYGTALQMATYWGHGNVTRLLLDKGADINAVGGAYGTALAAAACGGHEDLVQLLLERGADVNAHDVHYGNALQTAIFFGPEDVIRWLLKYGADVNDQGGYYGKPITAAIWLDKKKIVRLLFDNGAGIAHLEREVLDKAALLFSIGKCSESCMRSKLISTLNGDSRVTSCELCHEMGMVD